jgi:hypothetical protein
MLFLFIHVQSNVVWDFGTCCTWLI